MQLFVDFVRSSGAYAAGREPCFADPAMPVALLTASVFLDAEGKGARTDRCRVFHVEGGRYLSAQQLGEAGVRDLDTLVVVNTGVDCIRDPRVLGTYWQMAGGGARRDAHVGVPLRPGTAGQYAALAANSLH